MKVAVIRFPGSNCDLDMVSSLRTVPGVEPTMVWHGDGIPAGAYDAVVLPGGFSFGDRLRAGAIAASSPAMSGVRRMAEDGAPVLGVCNGFQTLVEAGLLPGALLRNTTLKFVCEWVNIRVENAHTSVTSKVSKGQVLRMPIAHGEGRFYLGHKELALLEREGCVAFRYCDPSGRVTKESNPTGTLNNIAGVCNERGNVVGLMPHPERAAEAILDPEGRNDGALILASFSNGRSGGR